MIGTSDQSCWLAEACKILILLLLGSIVLEDNGSEKVQSSSMVWPIGMLARMVK